MSYFEEKVKRYYNLFKQNKPILKAYAVVEKDGQFMVLTTNKGNWKYCLSGGSVDEGETTEIAIKRELLEELNVNVKVVKSLGFIKYKSHWKHKKTEFDIDNIAEIFYTKFESFGENLNIGLDGEFDTSSINIALISKDEMLENVAEFKEFGIKLD